jgi:hypothetical protein
MGSEVQRLNSEISSAKATLAQLPDRSDLRPSGGQELHPRADMGEPFKTKDSDKMAVEVN